MVENLNVPEGVLDAVKDSERQSRQDMKARLFAFHYGANIPEDLAQRTEDERKAWLENTPRRVADKIAEEVLIRLNASATEEVPDFDGTYPEVVVWAAAGAVAHATMEYALTTPGLSPVEPRSSELFSRAVSDSAFLGRIAMAQKEISALETEYSLLPRPIYSRHGLPLPHAQPVAEKIQGAKLRLNNLLKELEIR